MEWLGYPATHGFGSVVRQSLQAAAIDRMVCPEDTADLVLATSEAFANAVRHGDSGPGDTVWICQDWRPGEVTLHLRYRGAPFPAEPPHLPAPEATSGRGRYIMSRLMERVAYRFWDGWTEVTLSRPLRRAERTALRD
jgi:anti-sigma regulatory factor (Ser/Thr protein kinase)